MVGMPVFFCHLQLQIPVTLLQQLHPGQGKVHFSLIPTKLLCLTDFAEWFEVIKEHE